LPSRRLVAGVLLVATLAVRIAEVHSVSYRPINDGRSYLRLGSEIARLGSYSSRDSGAGGTRGPSAYFPPGYPYFLAGVDLLDGHTTPAGAAVQPARLAQAVLGTVTVALIGLVALEAFGSTVALIALALAAFYPVLIELSGTFVAENLLTPLVLAAVWAALRVRRARRRYAWIAVAGVLIGLATLTHVNAAVLLIPLGLAVWSVHPRWSLRALSSPALLLGTAVLTVAPWTIRNAIVMHAFIPISDESGITLVGTYNPASAANHQVPYKWRLFYGIPQDRPLVHSARHLTETELDSRLQSQAFRYIGDHPLAPLSVAYHNTLRLLELEGSFAWRASAYAMGLPRGLAEVGVISFWMLCVLALLGALTSAARRAPGWLWAVPVLLALTVVLVNVETPRFREPVDAFLILLAACAIAAILPRLRGSPIGGDRGSAPPARDTKLVEVV
jgi:4-amino-4-deoxy-L-arabinose transferase-like glycosyltransferase